MKYFWIANTLFWVLALIGRAQAGGDTDHPAVMVLLCTILANVADNNPMKERA